MDGVVTGLLLLTVLAQGIAIAMLRRRLNEIDHESAWITGMVVEMDADLAYMRHGVRGDVPEKERRPGLSYVLADGRLWHFPPHR